MRIKLSVPGQVLAIVGLALFSSCYVLPRPAGQEEASRRTAAADTLAAELQRYVAGTVYTYPELAARVGYHQHELASGERIDLDQELANWSPEVVESRLAMLDAHLTTLETKCPEADLGPADRADRRLVIAAIRAELFRLRDLALHTRGLLVHELSLAEALFSPLEVAYAPESERLADIVGRLQWVPAYAERAMRIVEHGNGPSNDAAAEINRALVAFVDEELPRRIGEDAGLKAAFAGSKQPVLDALGKLQAFIDKELPKKPERSFRLGAIPYGEHFGDLFHGLATPEEELAAARERVKTLRAELFELAKPLYCEKNRSDRALCGPTPEEIAAAKKAEEDKKKAEEDKKKAEEEKKKAEEEKKKAEEEKKKKAEEDKKKAEEEKKKAEEDKKKAEEEKKKAEEEKKKAEEELRKAEEDRKKAEAVLQAAEEASRKAEDDLRRAEEKKKKAEEEKKKAEEDKKKAEEDKKKAEEDKKKAEEDKKKAEEDKKKKAEEDKKKAEEDKKKAEEEKKKAEEEKKKAEEEKKKKAEEEKKKAEEEKKKAEEDKKKAEEEKKKAEEEKKKAEEKKKKKDEDKKKSDDKPLNPYDSGAPKKTDKEKPANPYSFLLPAAPTLVAAKPGDTPAPRKVTDKAQDKTEKKLATDSKPAEPASTNEAPRPVERPSAVTDRSSDPEGRVIAWVLAELGHDRPVGSATLDQLKEAIERQADLAGQRGVVRDTGTSGLARDPLRPYRRALGDLIVYQPAPTLQPTLDARLLVVEGELRAALNASGGEAMLELVAARVGVPGRHALARRLNAIAPDTRRAARFLCNDLAFTEGWALHAAMALFAAAPTPTAGSGIVAKLAALQAAAAAVIDIEIHTAERTEKEAVSFLTRDAFYPESEARRLFLAASLRPGSQVAADLGRAWFATFLAKKATDPKALKELHDRLLGLGTVPLDLVEELLVAPAEEPAQVETDTDQGTTTFSIVDAL